MNNGQRVAGAQQAGKCMVGGLVTRPRKPCSRFRHVVVVVTRFPNGGNPVAVHQHGSAGDGERGK